MENENIHISQFYSCSEVGISSELLYISEIGKYLSTYYGKALSIDGVVLPSVLKKSIYWDFFRLAVNKGWVVDTSLPKYETDITIQYPIDYATNKFKNFLFTLDECKYDSVDASMRNNSAEYNYSTPIPTQVCFESMNDEGWVWSIKGSCASDELVNSKSLNTSCATQAWVSLVAFVAVTRLMTGKPEVLGISFPYIIAKNQLALSDFMNVIDYSDAFNGWVLYAFEDNVSDMIQRQIGYESWWHKGEEMGYLNRWYSPKEKLAHLKNDLKVDVGDIVLLYERDYSTAYNFIKYINSCNVAIVRYISPTSVGLEVVQTVRTRYGSEKVFQNFTMAVKEMYLGSTRYKEWNSTKKTIDFTDLGVEYLMHTEKYFIVPLDMTEDTVVLDVSDYNGRDTSLSLDQNNTIYWLLKDYNIEFNEDKFLKTYFPKEEPVYKLFMEGSEIPQQYLVK